MRLTDLETFVWLATMRSFRAVAQRLNITQPAISARIATLERELDVVLFERNQRSVVLTSKGLQLLAHAQRMVNLAAELRALAKPDTMVGVVRIGVVETIVHTWLPELMERLHGRYPGLSIELTVDTTVNLRDRLVAREIDVACLMGPVAKPEMANRPACTFRLAWAASPKLQLPPRPLELRDIANLPIITYPRQSRPFLIIDDMLRRDDLCPAKVTWSSSLATTIQLAVDGFGIAAIPPEVIQDPLRRGALVLLAAHQPLPDLDYTVTYPTSPTNVVAAAVADLIVEVSAWYCLTCVDHAAIENAYHR
jgi:DNA-binding transcriptional LysR family regulator